MTETGSLPGPLRAIAIQLERDSGHQVTARLLGPRRCLLTCDNGTVRLDIVYRGYRRSRWRAHSSNVTIDGTRIPHGELPYNSVMGLLRDPNSRHDEYPLLDADAPTTAVTDLKIVPAKVLTIMRSIRKNVRAKQRTLLSIGAENCRSRWVIIATFDDGLTIRQNLHLLLHWATLDEQVFSPLERPVEIFRGDVDVTNSNEPVIQGLLRILTTSGHVEAAAPGPASIAQQSNGARSNSVETRRASVIRT
ncbi:hypothetical protein [Winogradskya humida]|uniref:Uncharacterized protein n=1 Tax=Winogradskya humida TaxID=113566 RepID=A0ABQ4A2F6_9ACTN|nr:hypothetical protein [Actinoplanes humidus]GIE24803.1 hypothetical protein Ahu01nite_079050 [Actinoplanes humidus]